MTPSDVRATSRRRFLQYLAASPPFRGSFAARTVRRHNYDGIDLTSFKGAGESSNLTWDTVKWMREVRRAKIVLKQVHSGSPAWRRPSASLARSSGRR